MTVSPTVFRGADTIDYATRHILDLAQTTHDLQVALYRCTWKHTAIYQAGDYYFT